MSWTRAQLTMALQPRTEEHVKEAQWPCHVHLHGMQGTELDAWGGQDTRAGLHQQLHIPVQASNMLFPPGIISASWMEFKAICKG